MEQITYRAVDAAPAEAVAEVVEHLSDEAAAEGMRRIDELILHAAHQLAVCEYRRRMLELYAQDADPDEDGRR